MVDNTPEGLRIQIVDQDGLAMFPVGHRHVRSHPCASDMVARVVNNCLKRSPSPVTPIRFLSRRTELRLYQLGTIGRSCSGTRRTLLSSRPGRSCRQGGRRADMGPARPAIRQCPEPSDHHRVLRDTQPLDGHVSRSSQVRCPPRTIARRLRAPPDAPGATCQAGPHRRQTLGGRFRHRIEPGWFDPMSSRSRVCRL